MNSNGGISIGATSALSSSTTSLDLPVGGSVRCFMCGSSLRNEAALDKHVILCAKGHLDTKQGSEDAIRDRERVEREAIDGNSVAGVTHGPLTGGGGGRNADTKTNPHDKEPKVSRDHSSVAATVEEPHVGAGETSADRGDANDDGALLSSRDRTADASGSTTPPQEGDPANVSNADGESTGGPASPKDTPGKRRRRRPAAGGSTSASATLEEDSSARRLQRTRLAEALQSLEEMQLANQERLREVQQQQQQQQTTTSGLTSPHQDPQSAASDVGPLPSSLLHDDEETAEGSAPGGTNCLRSPPLSSSFASSGRRSVMFSRHHSAKPQLTSPSSPSTTHHHVDPASKSEDSYRNPASSPNASAAAPPLTATRRGIVGGGSGSGTAPTPSMERCSSALTIPSAIRETDDFRLSVPARVGVAATHATGPTSPHSPPASQSGPVAAPHPVSPLLSSRAPATSRVSATILPAGSVAAVARSSTGAGVVRTRSTEARQPRGRVSSSPQPQRRSSTVAGRKVTSSSKHLDGTQSMNVSVELSHTGRSSTASRHRSTEAAAAPVTPLAGAGSGARGSVPAAAGRVTDSKSFPGTPGARHGPQSHAGGGSSLAASGSASTFAGQRSVRPPGTFSGRTGSHSHDGSATVTPQPDTAPPRSHALLHHTTVSSSGASRRFRATPSTSYGAARMHPTPAVSSTGLGSAVPGVTGMAVSAHAPPVHLTMSTGSLTISGPVPMPSHSSLRAPNRRVVPVSSSGVASTSVTAPTTGHSQPSPAASSTAVHGSGRSTLVLPPPPKRSSVSQPRSVSPGRDGHGLLHPHLGGRAQAGVVGGASSPAAQYCTECGNRYVDGAKFCAFCGHRREVHLVRSVDEVVAGTPDQRSLSRAGVHEDNAGEATADVRAEVAAHATVAA